jgi:hypothetical protein
MKRQRLNRLSHAKRAELNRQLKDAVDACLICPSYNEFCSPILFVRKADSSLRLSIDYRGPNEVTRKDAYLRLVLQRFKEKGLKLRLEKCFFGLQEMEYMGYTVSAGKISVSAKEVEAVAD